MKRQRAVFAIALGAMMFLGLAAARSQVRVSFGIHVDVPPPPNGYVEVMAEPPYPDAVWVRGCWSWNRYEQQNIWIPGHWAARHYGPVYREREFRHVPHGVAKGWWKKHGGGWKGEYGRGHGRYRYDR